MMAMYSSDTSGFDTWPIEMNHKNVGQRCEAYILVIIPQSLCANLVGGKDLVS